MRVLLLDPSRDTGPTLEPELPPGALHTAQGQAEGLQLLRSGRWDLVLLDSEFSGAGLELLGRMEQERIAPVVLLAAHPSLELTLAAIRLGAHDVLAKPPAPGRLREILGALELGRKSRALPEPSISREAIVGESPELLNVFKTVARAASSDATVLLLGESGTGKEMIARVLHGQSARARRPFVAINCAAVPENLLESELFGHEKGAFTGAVGKRIGRFQRASGGTLFLDEIGDMSLALQSKILRALQEREVEPVGGAESVPIDVRIVAATNSDLRRAVEEGRFREDLYYRLAVVSLQLPPLRSRGADLDRLAEHFAALYARVHGRPVRAIAHETLEILRAYRWPGNVRQLRNAMERAVVMSSGEILLPQHLPVEVARPEAVGDAQEPGEGPLRTFEEMEKLLIRRALRETGANLTLAAERLGVHRNTLRRKIAGYGLAPE